MVKELFLEGVTPEDITDDQPLFGSAMNLDSIDTLQLVLAIEQEFGLRIKTRELDRERMGTLTGIAGFVQELSEEQHAGKAGD